MKLSEIPIAGSVDANTLLVGLKTVGLTSTDYQFDIADIAAYLGAAASPVKANADVMGATVVAPITSYVAPADGTYIVNGYINVTAIATDQIQCEVSFVDENNVPKTMTCTFCNAAGAVSPTVNNTGFFTMSPCTVRAKSANTISVETVLSVSGGSFTADWGATISLLV